MKAKDILDAGFAYKVEDVDAFVNDSITQAWSVVVTEELFVSGAFSVPANGGVQSLTFQLQKQ